MERVFEEVDILESLDSDRVTRMIGAGYTDFTQGNNVKEVYHIVLEYINGCELFDFICITGSFSEDVCRYFFHQLVEGIEYIHEQGISHRDLKTQNILLDKRYNLIIADFGIATMKEINMTTAGTQVYAAPELLERWNQTDPDPYIGKIIDIFGLGVILFMMRTNDRPFEKAEVKDFYYQHFYKNKHKRFWECHSEFRSSGYFSKDFKDLINQLLAPNPTHRLSLSEIKDHPWYNVSIWANLVIYLDVHA